jgi:hypothetical protein
LKYKNMMPASPIRTPPINEASGVKFSIFYLP